MMKKLLLAISLIFAFAAQAHAQNSIGATLGIGQANTPSGGTITTGNGLTGNGSSGTPAALVGPVSIANGGTNATAAGATAANNIGALAISNNLSDVNSPSNSRANIGAAPTPSASCGDASHASSWTGTAWGCQAITGSGAPGGAAGNIQYNNAGAIGGIANTFVALPGTGSVQAALGDCAHYVFQNSHVYSSGDVFFDGTNTEYTTTGGTSAASGTPTWGSIGGAPVTSGGASFEAIAAGDFAPNGACNIELVPGGSYTEPSVDILGSVMPSGVAYLHTNGATISCTNSTAGGGCMVEGNHGHILGIRDGGITGASGAVLDAVIESESGYLKDFSTTNPITYHQTNFDLQGFTASASTGATINQALVWLDGIEGQGTVANGYFGGGPNNYVDLEVSDLTQQWNGITLDNLWVTMGGTGGSASASIGVDIECGTNGGISLGATKIWIVDPNSHGTTAPVWFQTNGSTTHACEDITGGPFYIETGTQTTGTGTAFLINRTFLVNLQGMMINDGGNTIQYGVDVTGAKSGQQFSGRCAGTVCATDVINDAVATTYTCATGGSFNYAPGISTSLCGG